MRWIFVFLVFLNIFFYLWQRQQTTGNAILVQNYADHSVNDNIPKIELLSEYLTTKSIDLITPPQIEPKEEDIEITEGHEQQTLTLEPVTCLYLGGVTNKEQLAVITPFIESIAPNIQTAIVKVEQTPKFYTYLIINDNKSKILEECHAAHINTLEVIRGPLKGQISLGSFVNKDAFSAIETNLKELGFDIKIEELPESAPSYWLRIPFAEQDLFNTKMLTRLSKQLPTMQQDLMVCDIPAIN